MFSNDLLGCRPQFPLSHILFSCDSKPNFRTSIPCLFIYFISLNFVFDINFTSSTYAISSILLIVMFLLANFEFLVTASSSKLNSVGEIDSHCCRYEYISAIPICQKFRLDQCLFGQEGSVGTRRQKLIVQRLATIRFEIRSHSVLHKRG